MKGQVLVKPCHKFYPFQRAAKGGHPVCLPALRDLGRQLVVGGSGWAFKGGGRAPRRASSNPSPECSPHGKTTTFDAS